jgi:YHS domain-containing protein
MYRDPVCGMIVDPDQTEWHCTYLSETFYFCSEACRDQFARDPQRYLRASVGTDDTDDLDV